MSKYLVDAEERWKTRFEVEATSEEEATSKIMKWYEMSGYNPEISGHAQIFDAEIEDIEQYELEEKISVDVDADLMAVTVLTGIEDLQEDLPEPGQGE